MAATKICRRDRDDVIVVVATAIVTVLRASPTLSRSTIAARCMRCCGPGWWTGSPRYCITTSGCSGWVVRRRADLTAVSGTARLAGPVVASTHMIYARCVARRLVCYAASAFSTSRGAGCLDRVLLQAVAGCWQSVTYTLRKMIAPFG